MEPKKKPLYQPWNEEAFLSDERVQAMTPIQRWMYRTLLQKAFFGSERPYLPNDEKRLWMLAGCESRAQWEENRDMVLEAFMPLRINGIDVLSQKRLVADWERIEEARETQAEKGRTSAKQRLAQAQPQSTTVEPQLNNGSTTVGEVKRSEEKRSEDKESKESDQIPSEPLSVSSHNETEQPGTPSLKPGDIGYWEDGQYSWARNTKQVFGILKEKWQNIVGRGHVVEMPFKGWRDSFVNMLNSSDADTIVPAFELWADERGKFNPTTQPIIDFMKDGWQNYTQRVGPLNKFASTDVVITEEMRAGWVADAKASCTANLVWYRAKLQESEGDYEANAQLFDEDTQRQMREEIERYKAKVAELEAEST